jgi:hypothetical protein
MKFDIHTNLGLFPGSDSHGKDHYCSKEELADHCNKFQLTHAMVLYPWNNYQILEDCQKLTSTRLYGIQCMFFNELIEFGHQPELSEVEIHSDKPLWVGVKFHSHRGWFNIDGKIQNGIDYADTRLMGKVLKRLPEGAIVSTHLQGTASPYNTSRALSIGNLACKFPMLKFLINHAGDYGPRAFVGRPSVIIGKDGKASTLLSHLKHREAIVSCVEVAKVMHNVFLDGSNFTVDKASILKETNKWCVGTDIPFADPKYYDFDLEEKDWIKFSGEDKVKKGYEEAVHFFEADMRTLLEEHQKAYGFSYIDQDEKDATKASKTKA